MLKARYFRVSIAVSLLLILGVVSLSCGLFPVRLAVESQPTDGGYVTPSTGLCKNGEEIVLIATAAAGYRFDHWEGAASGESPNFRLIMNGNKKAIAVYKKTYNLNVTAEPGSGGRVNPDGGVYDIGSEVTLSATPSPEWEFSYWEGDASGLHTPISVVMDSSKNITACFVQKTYLLNVNANPPNGGSTSPTSRYFTSGIQVEITAIPASGWKLDHWEGDASGRNESVTVTMDSKKDVTAYFMKAQYTLQTSVSPSGSGSISPSSSSFYFGAGIPLTATPADGWSFDQWGGDISGTNNPIVVTMTSNKNVTAYFTKVLIPSRAINLPSSAATQSTETIQRRFTWNYRGTWDWETSIPSSLYNYYRELPRPPTADYSVYVTHPLDDLYIDDLVNKLSEAAQQAGFTEYETVEFAITFVQSLPYSLDSVTTPYDEYPRYPIETIVDCGGDCEDTSILLTAILDKMGYGVVLLELPKHMAVGLKGSENIYGSYWEYEGNRYYYVETTGENWGIGEIPDEYKTASATIYPMIPVPILTDEFSVRSQGYTAEAIIIVSNLGTATAQNVTVLAGFDAGDRMVWNSQQSQPFTIGIDQEVTVTLNLQVPLGKHTRLFVQIILDGFAVDESYTDWFDT